MLPTAHATDYHVGPGQTYTTIGAVPWFSLQGGDAVYIHYQPTPYYEKILISTRGSANAWLKVIGVVGPNGELPVIDGAGATTGPNMHWRTAWVTGATYDIESDGVVSLVANNDAQVNPSYIDIENLSIRNGRIGGAYTGGNGVAGTYQLFTACIYAKNPQHLVLKNLEIANCENGFFNATGGTQDSPNWWEGLAADITISSSYFHGCGSAAGEVHEHTIYIQADRPVIEGNRFGPMLAGTGGNQIKSRSAGDVIRYNYIEGQMGGRFLDLVEDQDAYPTLANMPYYGHDFVYGNLLLQTVGDANSGIPAVHWDGDHYAGGRATAANTRLYFYDNTWVVRADPTYRGQTIFSVQDAGDNCPAGALTSKIDARNNIFYGYAVTPGGTPDFLAWASCANTNIDLANNWISPGFATCSWAACTGSITGLNTSTAPTNNDPGFVNIGAYDAHLTAGSSARGIGAALAPEVTNNLLGLDLTPNKQYVYHLQYAARLIAGAGADAGALAFTVAGPTKTPRSPLGFQTR
jgi:hypothetical protein